MEIKNKKYLAKGHRSIVYTAKYKNRKVAVKERKIGIGINEHLLNEGKILKRINKHKIGPKLYYYDKDKVIMEFVDGKRILDWLEDNKDNKKLVRKMIIELLNQCRKLDKLKIEKQEMIRPVKHVLIKKKLTLIDFERAKKKQNPGNVTQICEFLIRNNLMKRDLEKLKNYKHRQNDKNFTSLKQLLI